MIVRHRSEKSLTRLDEGGLEHVRQQGEDRVQRREVLLLLGLAVFDAGEELSEDGEIQDEGSGKERIL